MNDKHASASAAKNAAKNPLAILLWLLVGAGLMYGVSQTAITAAALFTG